MSKDNDEFHCQAASSLPEERYGKHADEANDELQVDPVTYEVRHQSEDACRHTPEVFDDNAGERSVFRRKQLAGHHETRQNDALPIMSVIVVTNLTRLKQ